MHNYDATKQVTTISVVLISGIALLGWWTDHAMLASWVPGIADMTFNTALCFMLLAVACLYSGSPRSISLGVGIFAMLSLFQDTFGVSFGIDNLLFDAHGYALSSPYPGRMSPNTAAGFLLASVTLAAMSSVKQSGRSAVILHALIMLLLLLACLGIGMTLLIADKPEGFAHFSSISLFTAIAFLLLSISLLCIYAKRHQQAALNAVLYSAIRLMYRLKYPQKFALISLVMLIPLAVLMSRELTLLEQQVDAAKLKIIAIAHIQSTDALLKAVPEHRGMLHTQLASPLAFQNTLQQKSIEIDRLFAANALVDQQHAAIIAVPDEWPAIQERWIKIKNNHHNPMVSWRLHTEIIALLGKHLRDVGATTLLSYDDDPFIHNLVAAQLEILPQLFEQIGQLRGQGAGFLARGYLSDSEQLMLASISSEISLLLHESQQLLTYALQYRSYPELAALHANFITRTNAFRAITDAQLLSANQPSLASESYFSVASRALAAGYAFNQRNMSILKELLKQRINDSISIQYSIKLSALLIVLLIMYLFWGFYRSVMNTIHALANAVERVRTGETDEITLLPAHDEMGEVVGSFNAIADELMRVSLQMRAVVDYTVDGILTIDEHGIIKSFNPAAEQMFGYLADEVIGKNITLLMPEQYRERHQQGLQRYCQFGKGAVVGTPKPLSVDGLMKDGSAFPMEVSISSMVMDDQQLFIGMVRNVSEQRQMEKQLQHAQKMEAVGALVGGVAHNFNNLLAGIIGKAYLAKRNAMQQPEKTIAQLESIEKISHQAGDMVKQLLTFAHKDFFREMQDTPLAILTKEGFKTSQLGISEDISLKLNITVPDIMVRCDANQIQQVLMNMMNNARDAVAECSEKSISVSLDSVIPDETFFNKHEALAAGEYACLTISDTGHGMDSETMQKIFDPFYTTKEVGLGTGLGLSSAFGSIAAHNGVIEVESELDRGTTFRVYLPCIQSDNNVDDKQHQPIEFSEHHSLVLLVDDEKLVVESMRDVLEDLGYQVITAYNGMEGLTCFQQRAGEIDIIITDVVMPVLGGVEMFRKIRTINSAIPTLFITGYDDGDIRLNEEEMQHSSVLAKPVQTAALSHTIRKILHES